MMKIISVERADADKLADNFFEDLLNWGAVPQRTAPLPEGWRGVYQDQLNQVVSIFRRAYAEDTKADRESLAALRVVEKEARGFITVLAANPALALKSAVSEWPEGYALDRYRGLYDGWKALKGLRKNADLRTGTQVEHLEKPKVFLQSEDAAVREVWNRLQKTPKEEWNISQTCREVAEEMKDRDGRSAEVIRTTFNRWKQKNLPGK
jgi:hypothetical protein